MQFFCHKIFRFSNCLNPFPQLLKHLKIILSSWTTEKQKIPGLPNPGLGHHCGLGSAALSYSNSPHTNIQYSFETTNLITTLSYLKSFSDYTTHRIVQIPSRGWQDLAWPLNLASTLFTSPAQASRWPSYNRFLWITAYYSLCSSFLLCLLHPLHLASGVTRLGDPSSPNTQYCTHYIFPVGLGVPATSSIVLDTWYLNALNMVWRRKWIRGGGAGSSASNPGGKGLWPQSCYSSVPAPGDFWLLKCFLKGNSANTEAI